jgi:Rod binding domain-containing protein
MTVSPHGTSLGAAPEPSAQAPAADPRIADAARQFEALLLTQLLRAAKQGGAEGWLGAGEDQAASSAMEFAEECFAQALAAQGGLGLANLITAQLSRATQACQPAASSSPACASSRQGLETPAGAGG